MSEINKIADIHIHSTMKPYHSSMGANKTDIWKYIKEKEYDGIKIFESFIKEIAKDSQANFDKCLEANLKIIFISLYPTERGWFDMRDLLEDNIPEHTRVKIGSRLSGFDKDLVKDIIQTIFNNGSIQYFSELEEEYQYLVSQASTEVNGKKFIVASGYDDILTALNQDNTIAVVVTIEGAHSLFDFQSYNELEKTYRYVEKNGISEYYKDVLEPNIINVKQWGEESGHNHTPLFITFAHHFWDLLGGHDRSFGFLQKIIFTNVEDFLRKYYHDDYLKKGIMH